MSIIKEMTDSVFNNGLAQVQAILDLVNNKDLYEGRLKELGTKKKELTKLIQVVGKVKEIDGLLHEAKEMKAEVAQEIVVLHTKQNDADNVIREAEKRGDAVMADSFARTREQKGALDTRENELNAFQKRLQEEQAQLIPKENKILQTQRALDAEMSRLKQLQKSADDMRKEYAERKSQIDSALSGL